MFFKQNSQNFSFEHAFGKMSYASGHGILALNYHSQGQVPGRMAAYPVLSFDIDYSAIEQTFRNWIRSECESVCRANATTQELEALAVHERCEAQAYPDRRMGEQDQWAQRQSLLAQKRHFHERIREHYSAQAENEKALDTLIDNHHQRVGEYAFRLDAMEREMRKSMARQAGYLFVPDDLGIKLFMRHIQEKAAACGVLPEEGTNWRGKAVWQSTRQGGADTTESLYVRIDKPDDVMKLIASLEAMDGESLFSQAECVDIERSLTMAKRQHEAETARSGSTGGKGRS